MLGGADNPNGELPSYITGADNIPITVKHRGVDSALLVHFSSISVAPVTDCQY